MNIISILLLKYVDDLLTLHQHQGQRSADPAAQRQPNIPRGQFLDL